MTALEPIQLRAAALDLDAVHGRRPDVAVLVFDLRGSGVVRNVMHIVDGAARAGLQVDVVVAKPTGGFHDAPELGRARVIRLLGDGTPRDRALASLWALAPLRRYLRTARPKLLFSAGNHIHQLAWASLRGLVQPPRLVLRASNDITHPHSGPILGPLSRLLSLSARPALRVLFGSADRVVPVAEELAATMIAHLGLDPARVTTIPNGIDTSHVRAQALAPLDHPWFAPGAPPVVMGIGRLSRQKNFPLLIEAFARLRMQRPVRLVILGAGSPGARERLLERARALGVGADVAILPFDRNPFRYLHRAALFVLSSSWEGMSNVLLEALACGCPVVATRCPTGTIEVLDDGRVGPLVPIDDAPALAQAMLARLDAPRDSATLMARAASYALDRSVARYVGLFEQMVQPQSAIGQPRA